MSSSRWRIRMLAGRLTPGAGSHAYNLNLIRKLAERGHEISVVCFDGGAGVASSAHDVHELKHRGWASARGVWPAATWLEHRHFDREIRRLPLEPVDVVIGAEHLFIDAHLGRFPATPLIYLPHSLLLAHEIAGYALPPRMERLTRAVYEGIQRRALRRAARVVRFTSTACDVLRDAWPEGKRARFEVNEVGLDVPGEVERRRQDVPAVLYVGQLAPRKRVHLVLEALAQSRDLAWTLDIVGDGSLRPELERTARDLGVAARVTFHGFQADPSPWYARADLLVLLSASESLGLVLLEAMVRGVPCLTLRSDGTNVSEDVIEDGRTGILAASPEDAARRLREALQNRARLAALGTAAQQETRAKYSWEAHLDRFEAIIGEVVREAT